MRYRARGQRQKYLRTRVHQARIEDCLTLNEPGSACVTLTERSSRPAVARPSAASKRASTSSSGAGHSPTRRTATASSAEHEEFAAVQILERRDLVVGDLAENHALDQPQRIGRAQDQRGGGEECVPDVGFERRQDHQELADETRGPRQAGIGQREQHHERREFRHGVDHAAVGADFAAVDPVVHARPTHRNMAPDTRPCDSICTMAPSNPNAMPVVLPGVRHDLKADEHAERDETHVRNRRVGNQLLHVALRQRHETDVHHGDQAISAMISQSSCRLASGAIGSENRRSRIRPFSA